MADDCPILLDVQMNYRRSGLRNVETCHGMSLRPDGLRSYVIPYSPAAPPLNGFENLFEITAILGAAILNFN